MTWQPLIQSNQTLSSSLAVQGMKLNLTSLSNKFNGKNITVSEFAQGCRQVSETIPKELEREFLKFAKSRLTEEALKALDGK